MKTKLLFIALFLFFFQFSFAQQFSFPMYFEDAAGNKDTIILGYDISATYGIDSVFGEENIINVLFKDGLDVRISNAKSFSNTDTATYKTKKQITFHTCNSTNWNTQCIEILTKHWPVKASWNKSEFTNSCNNGSFFTSTERAGLGGLPRFGSFKSIFFSQNDSIVFSSQVSKDGIIGTISGSDTISFFFQAFGDSTLFLNPDPVEKPVTKIVMVSPNPSYAFITVGSVGNSIMPNGDLQIFNIQGKLVKEIKIEPNLFQISIDIQSFNSGMYFGKIVSESGESLSFKFVKE